MSPARPTADVVVRQIRARAGDLVRGFFGIGVEILPHELVGVVIAENGGKLGTLRTDLADMNIDTVVTAIAQLAKELAAAVVELDPSDPRLCLGVTLGAPVDPAAGIVRYYANSTRDHGNGGQSYYWMDEDLSDRLQAATGCLTAIENDAHALAAYEQKLGAGPQSASFTVLLIRHGIGAGVVVDNRLLPIPVEVGHMMRWPDGRLCGFGLGAHIESWAGRLSIPELIAEETGLTGPVSFRWAVNLANGDHPATDAAAAVFGAAGTAIARGIAAILSVFGSPHLIIHAPEELIGDGAGRAAEEFMKALYTFREYTFPHLGMCMVTTRPLAVDRGAIGAALIALNRHYSVPLDSDPGSSAGAPGWSSSSAGGT